MAGSKIFLEPILSETVNGVDGAIQDVITVLDPVPEKIDDQILMLSKVANVIGSSVNNIAVTNGEEFSFPLLMILPETHVVVSASRDEGEYEKVTNNNTLTSTFFCYVNGKFSITIPNLVIDYAIRTNDSTGEESIIGKYELSRNGTTVKTGTFLSIIRENGTAETVSDRITTEKEYINNITCEANDEFVLTVTFEASCYGGTGAGSGATMSQWYGGKDFSAGYKLVDIVDRGIIVQE